MKTDGLKTQPLARLLLVLLAGALVAPVARAQAAARAPVPAADLAKYDKNGNGRLDADELAARDADTAKTVPVAATAAKSGAGVSRPDEVVQLSPFEVTSDTRGYFSANTMSGTRFNSKLEDLASSLTVVTKEQMSDFAMLDINDVFLYTASTEGTGTFTDYTVDRNGSVADNVQLDPSNANRVRGIASANISLGNYETMRRTPVDPLAIDGVEVSRGPNANVFGLGNPSGTVNQVPASANLTRDRTQLAFRADSYEGYRTSLDANRVLVPGKLAIRGSAAFQHDGFIRKPSGVNTVRYNGMIKFQPFHTTTLSGSFSYYKMNGTRPNFAPPRDYVSYWLKSGRPSWDPVTEQVHLNGATVGTYTNATGLPDYFSATFTGSARSQVFVDQGGIGYWTTPASTSITTPASGGQAIRLMAPTPSSGSAAGKITAQPLFTTTPSVSDKSLYDWSSLNLSSVNRAWDRNLTTMVQVDQVVFNTPRQSLVAQVGMMREDSQRYQRNLIGTLNDNGQSGQLLVDVNERLLDGSPNPYFGRPYIGTDQPRTELDPARWDTYRGQFAYKLDLTHEPGWLKFLGLHQLSGYDEYKYRINRRYSFRDAMADNHTWIPAGLYRGNQGSVSGTPALIGITRGYYRYYVGDKNGTNVDYAPADFNYGTFPFVWGGYTVSGNLPTNAGTFHSEPTQLAQVAVTDATGGGNNVKQLIKTEGAVLQSHFFNDRLVTTFGLRRDRTYAKSGSTPVLLNPDGETDNHQSMDHWAVGDWRANSGRTKTSGVVARPFRDFSFLAGAEKNGGLGGFLAGTVRGLALTYNKSDSFIPQTPAQDLFLNLLPDSTGVGKDYGFWLNLYGGRLVVRFNHYENTQLNARKGDANTIAQRVLRHDVSSADAFQLHNRAFDWVTAAHPDWTGDQIENEVAKEIGLSRDLQDALRNPVVPIAATNDILAKGNELEINFNPTRSWTVSASATETKSANVNVSDAVARYIALRMPIWTTIVDPRTNTLWWTTNYGGSQTAAQNFATFVETPYSVLKQQEGKSNPQIREYAARMSTSVRLAGLTDNATLQRFTVGGALRWEGKGAIGYYGLQSLPAVITALDPNRPIYDKARYYVDAFVSYRTKLWGDRIPVNFQLNVRNLQESGRLQAIGAYPDGTPNAYRIVDPRQFILQATFDL